MSEHTPGPWKVDAGNVVGPTGKLIADCWARSINDRVDARLIAAAPDLLAALRNIEIICTESANDCRKRMGTRVGNALVTARAAITKATGADQ